MREWNDVVDKSEDQCSSWQHLIFPAQPVSYIRVIGTQVFVVISENGCKIRSLKETGIFDF